MFLIDFISFYGKMSIEIKKYMLVNEQAHFSIIATNFKSDVPRSLDTKSKEKV